MPHTAHHVPPAEPPSGAGGPGGRCMNEERSMWGIAEHLNQELIKMKKEPFDKAVLTGVPNKHYYPDDDSMLPIGTVYFSILGHFRRITEGPPYYKSEPIAPGVDMPSQKRLIGTDNVHIRSPRVIR